MPADLIDTIRRGLRGEPPEDGGPWEIVRSLPHGHVVAVLRTVQRIGLDNVLASRPSRQRALVVALIVARILKPGSKLSTVRVLRQKTATSNLSLELGLEDIAAKSAKLPGSGRLEERHGLALRRAGDPQEHLGRVRRASRPAKPNVLE